MDTDLCEQKVYGKHMDNPWQLLGRTLFIAYVCAWFVWSNLALYGRELKKIQGSQSILLG